MKKSKLRQIIKEEISKVLKESREWRKDEYWDKLPFEYEGEGMYRSPQGFIFDENDEGELEAETQIRDYDNENDFYKNLEEIEGMISHYDYEITTLSWGAIIKIK